MFVGAHLWESTSRIIHKEEITFCVPDVRVFPVDIFLSASKQWFISYFTSLDGYYISRNTC